MLITTVSQGRGGRDGREKVLCLRGEVKWSKSSDLVDGSREIGEKEGSQLVLILQLRLQGLLKLSFPHVAFTPLILCRRLKIPEKMNDKKTKQPTGTAIQHKERVDSRGGLTEACCSGPACPWRHLGILLWSSPRATTSKTPSVYFSFCSCHQLTLPLGSCPSRSLASE